MSTSWFTRSASWFWRSTSWFSRSPYSSSRSPSRELDPPGRPSVVPVRCSVDLVVLWVALDRHEDRLGGGRARPRRSSPSSSRSASIDHESRNPFGTPKNDPAATRTPDSAAARSIVAVRSPPRASVANPKSPSRGALHARCGRDATHASTRARSRSWGWGSSTGGSRTSRSRRSS